MLQDFELKKIVKPLLSWFSGHARVLPWREDAAPYRVWVSEIMLQQTRVEAVKPYFERFVTALPDIRSLAECEEEKLLKLWEGLGYYNRVRNMQTAAKTVMEEYAGELPADYEKLLKLKGIGHYTAGAIASIAYQIPVPAVDGNVLRVISRVTADDSDIMKQSVKARMEVDSSCPIVFAPAFLMARSPFAPSPPIPVNIIPNACGPATFATESNNTSTDGRCPLTFDPFLHST